MTIFVPNYKISCRIKQGFNDANFVKIDCDRQQTPAGASVLCVVYDESRTRPFTGDELY